MGGDIMMMETLGNIQRLNQLFTTYDSFCLLAAEPFVPRD